MSSRTHVCISFIVLTLLQTLIPAAATASATAPKLNDGDEGATTKALPPTTVIVTSYPSDRDGKHLDDVITRHRRSTTTDDDVTETKFVTVAATNTTTSDDGDVIVMFVLELRQKRHLVTSSTMVIGNVRDAEVEEEDACGQYAGHIVGRRATSRAVVSLCPDGGINGIIRDGGKEYEIESLEEDDPVAGRSAADDDIERRRRRSSLKRPIVVNQPPEREIPKVEIPVDENNKARDETDADDNDGELLHGSEEDDVVAVEDTPEEELTIGVMVGLDYDVVQFHRNNRIEDYIVTLFNIVDEIFHHPSLGTKVKLVLTQIHYVSREQSLQIVVPNHPFQSIANVCNWRNNTIKKLKKRIYREDVTVYLSRHFAGDDYTGFAKHNGICYRRKGCCIVQENGFSRAIDIAHEIGHTLGMKHDETNTSCRARKGNIMSPKSKASSLNYYWSACSRDRLRRRLLKGHLSCLKDDPTPIQQFAKPLLYPGTLYSIDEQCRLAFGDQFLHPSSNTDFCTKLICYDPTEPTKYYTRHEPAMNATSCGNHQWCLGGRCVNKSAIGPDDGNWGEWANWSECTMSCGQGFIYRQRYCDAPPPKNGGRFCDGPSTEGTHCNVTTHNCSVASSPPPTMTSSSSKRKRKRRHRIRSNHHKHDYVAN